MIARGEATRCALPGDQVTITGIFLPTPYAGFKQIRIGLMADTFIEAQVGCFLDTDDCLPSSDHR